jgi:hypothetical protein
MSHFNCEQCGVTQVDSPEGYISGCCHYPPENNRTVVLQFGGDGSHDRNGFYAKQHGAFYFSVESMNQLKSVHPVAWCDLPF